jgi:mxaJ protein
MRSLLVRAAAALAFFFGGASSPMNVKPQPLADDLRICSDPNNLPFSNRNGEGFENKIAELIAKDLHKHVAYVYEVQRDNFIKNTLNAGRCDVVMGLPAGFDQALLTDSYYMSQYVFVYRAERKLALHSIKDKRLATLKIGVHLLGDADTPPVQALTQEGIVQNVVGFMIYGDVSKPNPPARLIEAVENGDIDIAAVWGPFGGYFAKRSAVPLKVVPIQDVEAFAPLAFRYEMAIGVRLDAESLRSQLNDIIARRRVEIRKILLDYGIPLADSGP